MPRSTRHSILCMIGARRFLALAVLAVALLGASGRHAIAASADNGDVQVNRDVLDSLGPPTGESASSAGRIQLHAPKAKSKPKHVAAAKSSAPKRPPAPPSSTPVAAVAPPESAATPSPAATPAASPIVPASAHSASHAAPPASAPAPSATASAAPSATVMSAPPAPPAPAAAAPGPLQTAAATPATPPLPPTRLIFAAGTADLPDGAKPELDKVAQWLGANSQARIEVVAYASGSAGEANQARRISLSRALAVRGYLAERGVATVRMEVRALGNRSENGAPADRVDVVAMDH